MGILKELFELNEAASPSKKKTKKSDTSKAEKPSKKPVDLKGISKPVNQPAGAAKSGAKKDAQVQDAPFAKNPSFDQFVAGNMWFDMAKSGSMSGTIRVKK